MGISGAENPLSTEIQWHVKDLERIEIEIIDQQ